MPSTPAVHTDPVALISELAADAIRRLDLAQFERRVRVAGSRERLAWRSAGGLVPVAELALNTAAEAFEAAVLARYQNLVGSRALHEDHRRSIVKFLSIADAPTDAQRRPGVLSVNT